MLMAQHRNTIKLFRQFEVIFPRIVGLMKTTKGEGNEM